MKEGGERVQKKIKLKSRINSSLIFHSALMQACMEMFGSPSQAKVTPSGQIDVSETDTLLCQAGGLIRQAMGLPEGRLTVEMVKKAKRWHKLENTVKSFLGNSLHLLGKRIQSQF